MKLATILHQENAIVAVLQGHQVYTLSSIITQFDLDPAWNTDMKTLIAEYLDDLVAWYKEHGELIDQLPYLVYSDVKFLPLLNEPGKVFSIGLNYAGHAADLDESTPDKYPGSFMRPSNRMIGHGDTIQLPELSERTTGEGELAIIIGRKCKDVPRDEWLNAVAGFTTVVDCTAEDILRLNPRFLTLSKSFDTYFSLGPVMITADEFTTPQIMDLEVSTLHNGGVFAANVVSNMTYPPDFLVEFLSRVMTFEPGDIISTGTPRAVPITKKDTVGARINGFYDLINKVDRK